MTRFRRSGTNWEGRKWEVVAPIGTLAGQIEAAHPARHGADGTVASKGHDANSPTSDHRPKPTTGSGVVRAIDIGEHANEVDGILDAIRASKDPRVRYGIHDGRIFSSYPRGGVAPYTWRPYTGGGHRNHGHLSTLDTADNQGAPWDIGTGTTPPPGDDDMETIKALQRQCNAGGFKGADGKALTVDGLLGKNTQHALDALAVAAAQNPVPGPRGPRGAQGVKGDDGEGIMSGDEIRLGTTAVVL